MERCAEIGEVELPTRLARHYASLPDWAGRDAWDFVIHRMARQRLDPGAVERTVRHLIDRHDALRARIDLRPTGQFMSFDPPGASSCFRTVAADNVPEEDVPAFLQDLSGHLQRELNLLTGPVFLVALIDLGTARPQQLLFIASHAVCDRWSMRVITVEFESIYKQVLAQGSVSLPPTLTTFADFLRHRSDYAKSNDFQRELPTWTKIFRDSSVSLRVDYEHDPADNNLGSSTELCDCLSMSDTSSFLSRQHPPYTEPKMKILRSFTHALREYGGIDIITTFALHHGRNAHIGRESLVRTVGNLITREPVSIRFAHFRCLDHKNRQYFEEMLRAPNYGAMRDWLPSDLMPRMQVSFNYLGHNHLINCDNRLLEPSSWAFRPWIDDRAPRASVLEFIGTIVDGKLCIKCTFSRNVYSEATVNGLLDETLRYVRATWCH